ncbi:MAG TPA: pantoate--beta-alanine ligase [Gammaproteobacteria bacterium]|nr:pantoate--beta-alanine ligase [Gammaproteobacteria bacterium]
MMKVEQVAPLRAAVAEWRAAGERVALVPTMGNLHAGHMALVARARELADRVVVSIFVNPLQFGPSEDLAAYPRTPEADRARLTKAGVDVLFAPDVDVMYPQGEALATVHVAGLEDILCGASRPGHFSGVATVVAKLFNMVAPDVAVFGNKDYQQLAVIRRMVADLAFPIEIVGVATVREPDGLAMSSRNRYLGQDERSRAPTLYQTLNEAAECISVGGRDFAALEASASQALQAAGFNPDYVAVRDPETLAAPDASSHRFVVLAAAWLGRARLIDNVVVEVNA